MASTKAELTRRGLLLPERLPTVIPLICQAGRGARLDFCRKVSWEVVGQFESTGPHILQALHFEQVSGNHAVGCGSQV